MFQSIRFRFTLIIMLLVTIPLLIVGVIISTNHETALADVAGQRLSLTAETVRYDIEEYFSDYVTQLQLLIDLDELRESDNLQILLLQSEGMAFISLLDATGQEVERFSRTRAFQQDDLRDLSQSLAFEHVRETGRIYYSPVEYDDTLREPLITVALPVINPRTGALEQMLQVGLRFQPVREIIAEQSLPDNMQAFLVSNRLGTILAHPNPTYVIQETPYTLSNHVHTTSSLQGERVLHAYEPMQLGSEEFTIVVEQPTRTAFALVDEARWLALLVTGLAAAASGMVVWLVVRQITTPIRDLSDAVQTIRAGDLSKRVRVHNHDEVGQLAQAFNHMTGQLADMVDNLEERIQERTQRLQQVEIELRHERNFLQSVINNSLSAIIVITPDGQIVLTNSHARDLLGLTEGELLDTDFTSARWHPTDFTGEPIPKDELPFYYILHTQEAVSDYEIAIVAADGTRLYLSMNGVPMLNASGEIERIVFTFNDISLRQRWQQQLEDALTREKELNELQARFVTLISHELRTPLSIILTSATLIQHNASRMKPESIVRRATKMQRQVERLRHIMNDVLFINRTDQQKHAVHYDRVDLMPLCQEIINDLMLTLENPPPVTLQADDMPEKIISDEVLLHHILSNLLSNALKYTAADGDVTLQIEPDENVYRFSVHDTGLGIPEAYQPKLFQSFVRADNVSNISGTGLGLVIVKRSVEMLGGTIDVSSQAGEGSTFSVTLPRLDTVPSDRMLTSPAEKRENGSGRAENRNQDTWLS